MQRDNRAQRRMVGFDNVLVIPVFCIADTPWSTSSSSPKLIDWSFINISDAIKEFTYQIGIMYAEDIIDFIMHAQISVSGGTGHLIFRDYTDDKDIVEITTTSTMKSNRKTTKFKIDKSLIKDDTVFALYAYIDSSGIYDEVYVGKVLLAIRYRM